MPFHKHKCRLCNELTLGDLCQDHSLQAGKVWMERWVPESRWNAGLHYYFMLEVQAIWKDFTTINQN